MVGVVGGVGRGWSKGWVGIFLRWDVSVGVGMGGGE